MPRNTWIRLKFPKKMALHKHNNIDVITHQKHIMKILKN